LLRNKKTSLRNTLYLCSLSLSLSLSLCAFSYLVISGIPSSKGAITNPWLQMKPLSAACFGIRSPGGLHECHADKNKSWNESFTSEQASAAVALDHRHTDNEANPNPQTSTARRNNTTPQALPPPPRARRRWYHPPGWMEKKFHTLDGICFRLL
jgi:hypothetical protein